MCVCARARPLKSDVITATGSVTNLVGGRNVATICFAVAVIVIGVVAVVFLKMLINVITIALTVFAIMMIVKAFAIW